MQSSSDQTIESQIPHSRVPTRRISFDESLHKIPKHFAADDDLILSHLTACLSGLFPDGEDFFVRSVRHYRTKITDPELKAQVAGFIGQEATHGREHRSLNDRFDELGYPVRRYERFTKRGLGLRTRFAPPISNLAATVALEHFTATLAELLLTNDETKALFNNDDLRNLFLWHALEESEHKAVAFDVYRSVGGSERLRVWTMRELRYGFPLFLAIQTVISLLGDRETYRRGRLRKSWRTFRTSPLVGHDVWRQLCDFDRADFHPDDSDTNGLVEQWRERLFGADGQIKDLLKAKAA